MTPGALTLEMSIAPQSAYKLIVQPSFSDLVPGNFPFRGSLSEFTSEGYDDVVNKRTIITLNHTGNISHRRDAGCDLIYNKLMNATTRVVTVGEAYAATKLCQNTLYQGALKDVRSGDPLFKKRITPFFRSAVNQDLATNGYFGDISRFVPANRMYSTNVFNGIFYYMKRFIGAGIIPSSGANQKAFTIADGTDFTATGGPEAAFNIVKQLYNAQSNDLLFYNWADSDKVIYASKEIVKGVEDYYTLTSINALGYSLLASGIKQISYKGIPIVEQPLWTTVISEIKGSRGYAAVLTIRGNFVFAFNKNYGEGPDLDQAFRLFYDDLTMQWYWQYFYTAGTMIALPEYVAVAMSAWN